jgi:hypothetical protein
VADIQVAKLTQVKQGYNGIVNAVNLIPAAIKACSVVKDD